MDLKPTLTIIKTEKVDLELFPSPGEWRLPRRAPQLWVGVSPAAPPRRRLAVPFQACASVPERAMLVAAGEKQAGGLLVARDPGLGGGIYFHSCVFVKSGKKLIECPAPPFPLLYLFFSK